MATGIRFDQGWIAPQLYLLRDTIHFSNFRPRAHASNFMGSVSALVQNCSNVGALALTQILLVSSQGKTWIFLWEVSSATSSCTWWHWILHEEPTNSDFSIHFRFTQFPQRRNVCCSPFLCIKIDPRVVRCACHCNPVMSILNLEVTLDLVWCLLAFIGVYWSPPRNKIIHWKRESRIWVCLKMW